MNIWLTRMAQYTLEALLGLLLACLMIHVIAVSTKELDFVYGAF